MTEPIILSNFYGARNCSLCPEVPVNIFSSPNDYVAFFGNDTLPVYGCFFGTYRSLRGWWGFESTIQATGANPTLGLFPCSDTCVNPRQTTENCNQEFPRNSQIKSIKPSAPSPTTTSGTDLRSTTVSNPDQTPNNTAVIVGVISGVIAAIICSIIGTYFIRRKKNIKKMELDQKLNSTSTLPSVAPTVLIKGDEEDVVYIQGD
ncbi:hypothetical protein HK098_003954 [Nowakowskiella sp. JEL0407]|nr:hypothetical protein HK098_003954 [Nowakowskiella sp. JEL0407]